MSSQTWLITGGAGYIGTHVADLFIADGKDVVLLDSLYQGLSSRVDYLRKKHNTDIPLEVVDIRDYTAIENIIENNNFLIPCFCARFNNSVVAVKLTSLYSSGFSTDSPTALSAAV